LSDDLPTAANPAPKSPTDDEIAALLRADRPGRPKPDPNLPSPRLPEGLYYYLFILVEATMVMGVWGFMRRGPEAVMKGPGLDAPLGRQLVFHLNSMLQGVVSLSASAPWIPLGVLLLAAGVFLPTTSGKRKRMATVISTVIVAVFVVLIALQFSADMSMATSAVG